MSFRFPLPLDIMLITLFSVPPRKPDVESKSPSILSNNLKLHQDVFELLGVIIRGFITGAQILIFTKCTYYDLLLPVPYQMPMILSRKFCLIVCHGILGFEIPKYLRKHDYA